MVKRVGADSGLEERGEGFKFDCGEAGGEKTIAAWHLSWRQIQASQ